MRAVYLILGIVQCFVYFCQQRDERAESPGRRAQSLQKQLPSRAYSENLFDDQACKSVRVVNPPWRGGMVLLSW
jgi:hypothetical protein